LPPERPRNDDRDRVPPSHPPHANNTSFISVSQRSHLTLAIAVSFDVPDATCQTINLHRRPPRRSAAWVVVHGGWSRSDFNVVAHCLLFFYKINIGDSPTPIRRCSSMLRCCRFSMFHVYIGRTLLIDFIPYLEVKESAGVHTGVTRPPECSS